MADKIKAAGPARIRALNRKAVLNYIRKNGPISRSGLIPALDLSAAAVSSVTNELVEGGLLRPAEPGVASEYASRGRPKSPLELNPDAVYAIGLRLHPVDRQCRIQRAWINYAGHIERLPAQVFNDYHNTDGVIDAILAALSSVEQSVPDRHKILAATIAIPGPISQNEVLIAPSLRAIEGRSFAPAIAHQANYPISLLNDVNLAVLSELHLQPRLKQLNFSYLYIGLGVGAGVGLDGSLWSGNGWAGEVGHLRISRNGDEPPKSFEEMLSTDGAFVDESNRLGLAHDDLDGIAQADIDNNKGTSSALDDYARTLFELVLVISSVLGLDEVIIDFPSDLLFSRLQSRFKLLLTQQPLQLAISSPVKGNGAAVRGAALAALDLAIDQVE
jgi:predicted NBD/HSP70 family sugar kinase